MNTPPPPNPAFDVVEEPSPGGDVVDATEDEATKRERDAALASTFDPALAHHGKTDEELIEERQDETRELLDTAIAATIVIAIAENANFDVREAADDDDTEDASE